MTTPEPFEPIYPKNSVGNHYYTFVKDVPKEEEERKFSIWPSRNVLNNLLKHYLSSEECRVGILYGVEGVDHPSLFHIDENYSYGLNKAVIKGILQNYFRSEYVRVDDDAVFQEIGRALKELHDDTEIEDGPFLIEEMEKYKRAEEQKKSLKEYRNLTPNALAELIDQLE
ncbi:hypothetical protein TNCV_2383161 [Trichonephila clavipes]|nr:hypothetical protein TNCV_2383161 [Trichonephila clavipes]